ncbi:hypothetical protein TPHA_0I02520 [Tetrapisispora phaffii CBS 4417]|uniref:Integrase catalytic domain-containing protein n=1 Tax=Tetrapisispora phaffii (strain ATCC 24235 / CBS 4417 / NBRC 1672 / NRRL Y-8282 / UCD 70-5) TaxID=1071381 RepID=G8BXX6_TETPH|nr:hypothetical protein TPHA_0I02520 [Tetrapisispora phaffii CBS 4417]CCE64754.1 hypothetical protein TPHA_0I02520 [Tetrapisispora phaffii CBS 4417]
MDNDHSSSQVVKETLQSNIEIPNENTDVFIRTFKNRLSTLEGLYEKTMMKHDEFLNSIEAGDYLSKITKLEEEEKGLELNIEKLRTKIIDREGLLNNRTTAHTRTSINNTVTNGSNKEEGNQQTNLMNNGSLMFKTLKGKEVVINKNYLPLNIEFKLINIEDLPLWIKEFVKFLNYYNLDNLNELPESTIIDPVEDQFIKGQLKENIKCEDIYDFIFMENSSIEILNEVKRIFLRKLNFAKRQKLWKQVSITEKSNNLALQLNLLNKLVGIEEFIDTNKMEIFNLIINRINNQVLQRINAVPIDLSKITPTQYLGIIKKRAEDAFEFHEQIKQFYSSEREEAKSNSKNPETLRPIVKKVQRNPVQTKISTKKNQLKSAVDTVIDSGSGINFTNKKGLIFNYRKLTTIPEYSGVGSSSNLQIIGQGSLRVRMDNNGKYQYIPVYYCPDEDATVLSAFGLRKTLGFIITEDYKNLKNDSISIKIHNVANTTWIKSDDLLLSSKDNRTSEKLTKASSIRWIKPSTSFNNKTVTIHEAHERSNHLPVDVIVHNIENNAFSDVNKINLKKSELINFYCEQCAQAKMKQHDHIKDSMNKHYEQMQPGQSWSLDIRGPLGKNLAKVDNYLLLMVDNVSRFLLVSTHTNKNKETISLQIKNNIQYIEKQYDRIVKELIVDRGSEFTNDSLKTYVSEKGIKLMLTDTNDHASNARAERFIGIMNNDIRTLMHYSDLPWALWKYAALAAARIRNLFMTKKLNCSPMTTLSGKNEQIRFNSFLPFGAHAFVKNQTNNKLTNQGIPAITLCKDPNSFGYLFYLPQTRKVISTMSYILANSEVNGDFIDPNKVLSEIVPDNDDTNEVTSEDALEIEAEPSNADDITIIEGIENDTQYKIPPNIQEDTVYGLDTININDNQKVSDHTRSSTADEEVKEPTLEQDTSNTSDNHSVHEAHMSTLPKDTATATSHIDILPDSVAESEPVKNVSDQELLLINRFDNKNSDKFPSTEAMKQRRTKLFLKEFASITRRPLKSRKRELTTLDLEGFEAAEEQKKKIKLRSVQAVNKIRTLYFKTAITNNTDVRGRKLFSEAFEKELQNLLKMQVFDTSISIPRNQVPANRIIPLQTIFTVKRDGTHKARIVCRGDKQTEATYSNYHTDLLQIDTLKLFLMIANNRKMWIQTLDINHAFLYADLREEIYVPLPHDRRFVTPLKKALYGLKQSPKEWNEHLKKFLNSIDLDDSRHTPGIFRNHDYSIMIAVYVDDCVIAAKSQELLDEFVSTLRNRFELKIIGKMNQGILRTDVLGMDLDYNIDEGKISLSLQSYIESIENDWLDKISHIKTTSTPHVSSYEHNIKNIDSMDTKTRSKKINELQKINGVINYIRSRCRYDVEFAANKLARSVNFPADNVFYMADKLMNYIFQTKSEKLVFTRETTDNPAITLLSDASLGTEHDMKSRMGIMLWYGENLYKVISRASSAVRNSSTEAELDAIYEGSKEAYYLKKILEEMNLQKDPTVISITDS